MIFTTATVLAWAEEMTPWAVYEIETMERSVLEEAFSSIHRQGEYDLVFVKGGVMKQTVHEGIRANGTPAYDRGKLCLNLQKS